jgi:hypothetical protein
VWKNATVFPAGSRLATAIGGTTMIGTAFVDFVELCQRKEHEFSEPCRIIAS